MKRTSVLVFLCVILLVLSAAVAADVPYLTGRVTDNAGILSTGALKTLTESLKAHEDMTGNQVAVLTIPTLDGEGIEEYAVRVFEAWKLGQKGKDNGVLMVVVPEDRRMRIEVGYGLEGTLTDLMAGRIIEHVMAPCFRNGDYDGGITEGAAAIVKVLEGGEVPQATGGAGTVKRSGGIMEPDLPIIQRILFGAFIFGIIGLFTVIGILTPGVGWFLYFFLIPFWAMFPIVVLGARGALVCLAGYLVVFPIAKLLLKNSDFYKKGVMSLRTKGRASIGGFTFSSGRGGGGFTSSSSGFSGGGGSSGGGGASGSW
ncbi:MAG: YgcG family protein [Syntrophorhabdus sp.]|nr:YgcG family protein [Syntrophorhabdus sp.]